jgi:hypothetical protein
MRTTMAVCAVLLLTSAVAQSEERAAMKEFVLIFRQGSRTLSAEEQTRRAEEIQVWVALQAREGRKLDPRMMAAATYRITPDGESGPSQAGEGAVIGTVFVEAKSFDDAVTAARQHPAPRYGVSIEVRPWSSPVRAASDAR